MALGNGLEVANNRVLTINIHLKDQIPMKFLSLFLLCLFPLALHAQKAGEESKHVLRIASVTKLPQEQYYLLTEGEEPIQIEASSWQLSQSVVVSSGRKYYLSTKLPDVEKNESIATYAVCVFRPNLSRQMRDNTSIWD